jgi:hypothetical protein
VDFHKELLRSQNAVSQDGRPWAWTAMEKVAAQDTEETAA